MVELGEISPSSTPIRNRKALRKARKAYSKALNNNSELKASNEETQVERPPGKPQKPEDAVEYECCICRDEFLFLEGVATCAEHFLCNECVVNSYNAAIKDMEAFPARCCTPLARRLVEHLLSPEIRKAYSAKATEHYTSRVLRVYCVNDDCGSFIPKEEFDNDHAWSTVAPCKCGQKTCVGCKRQWEGKGHRCADADGPEVKPGWLPEYSSTCRIKQCPGCRMWIEHKDACNHMTCCYCRHQFCFVCMQPWDEMGFHEGFGCPLYGDPRRGYDGEGYEKSKRGLHRDTGYSREGIDRFGRHRLGHLVGNQQFDDRLDAHAEAWQEDQDYEYYDGGPIGLREEDDYPAANNNEEAHRLDEVFMENPHPYECRCAECNALVQRLRNLFREQEEPVEVEEDHPLGRAGGAVVATADLTLEAHQVYPTNGEANAGQERVGQADLDEQFAELVELTRRQVLFNNDNLIDREAPGVAAAAGAPRNVLSLAASWSRRHWNDINVVEIRLAEPGPQQHQRISPPSDAVRRELRLRQRVPLLGPNPNPGTGLVDFEVPTFRQIDCDHSWHREYLCYTQFNYVMCPGCCYIAEDWVNCCATCGLVACDSCSNGFTSSSLRWLDEIENRVGVIIWAESGAVPYKLEHLRSRELRHVDMWGGCDASALGLATMMDLWEERYKECHPFMDQNFGIKLMFEELERGMRREYWPVAEENVGLLGFTMTFDLATNPYAPLLWDDEF